MQKCRICFFI